MTGNLLSYYGMADRPICAGIFLDITNAEVRVIAELLGQEAREALDADRLDIWDTLSTLANRLLVTAAGMDREAAE